MVSILDQLRAEDIFSVVEFSSEIKVCRIKYSIKFYFLIKYKIIFFKKEWDLTKGYKGPEPDYYWPQPSEQTPETTASTEKIPVEKKSFGSFDDIFAYQVTNASILRAKEFVNKMEATGYINLTKCF
jgi:hypothetical protein